MSLGSLPLEVLLTITKHLTTPEYGNLRLTCKTVEKLCFEDWAKEYFSTRQFSLTRFSLQNLLDISSDAALNPYLQRLIISTDHVDLPNPNDTYVQDQEHLRTTGVDRAMLVEAMTRLTHCRVLEVRDYYSRFNGGRTRDNTSWKSYGATTFEKETGRALTFDITHEGTYDTSTVFAKVLSAAQASSLRPATLVVSPRLWGRMLKIRSAAFHIPPNEHSSYSKLLESLDSMTLHLGTRSLHEGMGFVSDLTARLSVFVNFMSLATNLHSLRLNCEIINSMDCSSIFNHIRTSLQLPMLSCLELGVLRIGEKALTDFLIHFITVEAITFFRVLLSDGTWASLLGEVATKLPHLRSLRLNLVKQTGILYKTQSDVKVAFMTSDAEVHSFSDPCIKPDYTIADNFDLKSKVDAASSAIVVEDDAFVKAHRDPNAPDSDEDSSSNSDVDSEDEVDLVDDDGEDSEEDDVE